MTESERATQQPQETPRERATRRLLALTALETAISQQKAKLRAECAELFTKGGQREVAELPDGTPLGNVRLDPAKGAWKVTDEPAFRAWVDQQTAGAELLVTRIESVNPAYEKAILARMTSPDPAWSWYDENGEEIDTPPGVTYVPGATKLVVTGDKSAAEQVRVMVAGLPALSWLDS